jgi:hypothetical protein
MNATIHITGLQQLESRLARLAIRIPQEVGRALYEVAQEEATESRRRTPVDTSALKNSHAVSRPLFLGRTISVTISVGGPSAPYAVYVHENLDAFHPVGQAKFLESTILESKPYLAQRIARRVSLGRL